MNNVHFFQPKIWGTGDFQPSLWTLAGRKNFRAALWSPAREPPNGYIRFLLRTRQWRPRSVERKTSPCGWVQEYKGERGGRKCLLWARAERAGSEGGKTPLGGLEVEWGRDLCVFVQRQPGRLGGWGEAATSSSSGAPIPLSHIPPGHLPHPEWAGLALS